MKTAICQEIVAIKTEMIQLVMQHFRKHPQLSSENEDTLSEKNIISDARLK